MASRFPGSARGGSASPSLVLPFAALGLAGGWLAGDIFEVRDEPVRWLLAFMTPVVAATLGAHLGPHVLGVAPDSDGSSAAGDLPDRAPWLPRGWLARTLRTLLAIAAAGILNGMFIGLVLIPPLGALFGGVFGLLCAGPFVPPLAAVILAARRVGRARAGSMVDASDRRAVWLAVAVVTGAGWLLGSVAWPPSSAEPEVLAVVRHGVVGLAVAGVAWAFVADAAGLVRLTKAGRSEGGAWGEGALNEGARSEGRGAGEAGGERAGAGEVRDGEGEGGDGERGWAALEGALEAAAADGAEVMDLGLGDDLWVEAAPAAHVYRGARRVRRVVRGSRARAAAALRGGMVRAGLALAAGAALWARPWG